MKQILVSIIRSPRTPKLLKFVFSFSLLSVLVYAVDVSELFRVANQAKIEWLGLAFSLYFVGYFIGSIRWKILLRIVGVNAPFRKLYGSYLVASFFNNILPSTIGGDVVRAYDSTRLGASLPDAMVTIFIDRLFGVFALGVFAGFSTLLLTSSVLGTEFVTAIFVVMLGSGAFLSYLLLSDRRSLNLGFLPDAINQKINELIRALARFRGRYGTFLGCGIFALLLQTNVVMGQYFVARAMGVDLPLEVFFLIVPVALVILMIPITIAGIGLREGVFLVLLGSYGVEASTIIVFSLAIYLLGLSQGLLGGVVYIFRKDKSSTRSHVDAPQA